MNEAKKKEAEEEAKIAYDKLHASITGDSDNGVDKYLWWKKERDSLQSKGHTDQASNANEAMQPALENMNKYNEMAIKLGASGAKNVQIIDIQTGKFHDLTPAVIASTKAIDSNAKVVDASQTSAERYATAMGKVATVMQTAKGVISDSNGILDKHAKSNEWDLDAIIKLSAKYPDLLTCLGNDADMTKELNKIKQTEKNTVLDSLKAQVTANDATVNDMAKAYGVDISNKNLSEEAKNKLVKDAVLKRIAIYQTELDAILAVNSAVEAMSNKTSPLQKYLLTTPINPSSTGKATNPLGKYSLTGDKTTAKSDGGFGVIAPNSKDTARTDAVEAELAKLRTQLKSLDTSSATYKKLKATSGSLEKYLTSAGDKANDGTATKDDAKKKAEDALNNAFELALKGFDGRVKVTTARIAILNNELATTTDAKKAGVLNSQILSSLNQELAITKEKDAYITREIASRKYTSAQLLDMKDKLLDIKQTESSIALEIRQKVVDAIKKASDTLIAGYQKQIDLINAKSDAEDKTTAKLKLQNDLIKEQLALKTAQTELTVRVEKDGKWSWQADQSAIKTAQEAITATQAEIAKGATQDKVDALNVLIKGEQTKQSKLTGYATGTDYVPQTGKYKVGENGEEEVILPQGSQVIPNNKVLGSQTTSSSSIATGNNSNGGSILEGLLTDDPSKTKKAVRDLLTSVDDSVNKFVKDSPQYSIDTDRNIGQALSENDDLVKNPVDRLIQDITFNLQKFVNASKGFGRNTDKNIGDAVTANDDLLISPMNALIAKVQVGIDAFVADSYNSGKGVVTELGKGVTDSTKDITAIVKTLTDKVVKTFRTEFGINSPSLVMKGIGEFLMEGLANGVDSKDINTFIQAKFDNMATTAKSSVGGAVTGNLKTWLTQAMSATGVDPSYLNSLADIARKESSGNPLAQNNWDSNALKGTPSKGLMQVIDPTFQQNKLAGHDDIWNPVDNAIASIRYMISRYGSIENVPGLKAMQGGGSYVGYETGTDYVPKTDQYRINEAGGEIVTLPQGAGVINHEFTKNLMDWGKFKPSEMLANIMPKFKMPDFSSFKPSLVGIPMGKGNTTFNIDHVVLPDVTDGNEFMDKLVAFSKTH